MGCWDETCAVTRTSIKWGEPVLVIWTNVEWMKTTYDLSSFRSSDLRHKESVAKYKEQGIDIPSIDNRFVKWKFGTYNDYGFIEEETLPEDCDCFLIHAAIACKMVKFGRKEPTIFEENEEMREDLILNLCHAAHMARIQLFGHKLLGLQHRDSKEMKAVLRLSLVILRHQIKMAIGQFVSDFKHWVDWKVTWPIKSFFIREKDNE